jgi:hypothetical protein
VLSDQLGFAQIATKIATKPARFVALVTIARTPPVRPRRESAWRRWLCRFPWENRSPREARSSVREVPRSRESYGVARGIRSSIFGVHRPGGCVNTRPVTRLSWWRQSRAELTDVLKACAPGRVDPSSFVSAVESRRVEPCGQSVGKTAKMCPIRLTIRHT